MHRGKVDPGVSELPRGNELSRDHVNRPLVTMKTNENFASDFVSFTSVSNVLTSCLNFKSLVYDKITTHFSIPKTPKLSCLAHISKVISF